MQDFLTQTFYGNTIAQWGVALGIGVAAFILGKAVYWLTGAVIRRGAHRTDTEIDDLVVDAIDGPIVVIATVLGLWIAVQTLTLTPRVEAFVWNALQAAMVLAVTLMLARLWGAFARRVLAPLAASSETDLDDQLLPIARRGGKTAIWILGVIVALNNAGVDVGALIAGVGIGGIALAMASKDTIANVFGGFTIFTDRPFTINDRVVIGGVDGTVSEIGVRSTRLRKLDGREVTIPNSRIADSPVENVTREPTRKVTVNLGLTCSTPPEGMRRAMEVLREIAEAHAESLAVDKTVIAFNEFGDWAFNVVFVYYIVPGADIMATQTSVNMAILERFNAEGLELAFPTRTVHTVAGT